VASPSHVDPAGADARPSEGAGAPPAVAAEAGLRISDAAARAGVSARTLRYYEELGLLTPSGYTAGGERRYRQEDLVRLDRILELREVLGMNLEEIKGFLDSETRLEEVREAYRARKGLGTKVARAQQRALLEEALALNEALAEQVGAKLSRMDDFRGRLLASARRCRELLDDL
jgi:DNA-binding transcriptional MerR regulator